MELFSKSFKYYIYTTHKSADNTLSDKFNLGIMLPLFKNIFPQLFQSREVASLTLLKWHLQSISLVYCVLNFIRQFSLENLANFSFGRNRESRWLPQDTPPGGSRKKGVCGHWSESGNRYRYRWGCQAAWKWCMHWQSYFWRWTDYSCACQSRAGKYCEATSE